MKLLSSDFKQNGPIPVRFTDEGENISPSLDWSDVPKESGSFTVICEDLDAPKKTKDSPNFTHWLIYNISPNVGSLPQGIPTTAELELPVLASQGKNSFGGIGYDGPMPPVGSGPHRYVFTVYACRKKLEVKPGAEKNEVLKAMKGNILAQVEITGLYERTKQKTFEQSNSLRP